MGGRKGPSSRAILGGGRGGARAKREVSRSIEKSSSIVAAKVLVAVIATSDPTVAALYFAYKLAKRTLPIVEKAVTTYKKTGDEEKVKEAVVKETVKQVGEEVKERTISAAVGVTWENTKATEHIASDTIRDTVVTTAVSETIVEVIKNEKS